MTFLYICVLSCFVDQWTRSLSCSQNCLFTHCCTSCLVYLLYSPFTSLLCLYNIAEAPRACVWKIKNKQECVTVSHAFRIQGQVENVLTCSFEIKKGPIMYRSAEIETALTWKASRGCHQCHHAEKQKYWEVQCDDSGHNRIHKCTWPTHTGQTGIYSLVIVLIACMAER